MTNTRSYVKHIFDKYGATASFSDDDTYCFVSIPEPLCINQIAELHRAGIEFRSYVPAAGLSRGIFVYYINLNK